MKNTFSRRLLALVMSVLMVIGMTPSVFAYNGQTRVAFERVANGVVDTSSAKTSSRVSETESSVPAYGEHDVVRVSIFLEDASTMEAYAKDAAEGTLTENANALSYRAMLQNTQDSVAAEISAKVLNHEALNVVWNLTLAANAISAYVEYGKVAAIEQVPGVRKVVVEEQYAPAVYEVGSDDPQMEVSTGMTGMTTAWSSGYTGAGMRIAIIDTGLDTLHQSMDEGAYWYALAEDAELAGVSVDEYIASLDLLDEEEIASKLSQLHVKNGYTADKLYETGKVAFGYNYVDGNLNIQHLSDTQGEHGSHVAGIAAANRYLPDGNGGYVSALDTIHMNGNAPDAQLIIMKVFGASGGAYSSDYMAAIEDAVVLGADTVNLSLGSGNPGFAKADAEEYQTILDNLAKSNTVVSMSAGNSGYWAENAQPVGYLYSDDVSMQTDGSPGSYTNSLAVASVENDGMIGSFMKFNEYVVGIYETSYTNAPLKTISGEQEFILFANDANKFAVDASGNNLLADYADVTKGKVVFVSRGNSSFYQKHMAAEQVGALACVVYNNVAGGTFGMDLSSSTATIPCVSVSLEDANYILKNAKATYNANGEVVYYTGTIDVCGFGAAQYNSDYKTMSDFSAWGVPGDLSLKPEITAPGGNIYSLNGAHKGDDPHEDHNRYELMSGTSMAAPQITGIGAVVKQYVENNNLLQTSITDRALVQSLLMSTAKPLKNVYADMDGNLVEYYYPVIQQGAGLVDAAAATSADSYILMGSDATASWMDGKVKAELGDDPARTGEYSFSFSVNNMDGRDHQYTLDADFFTQDLIGDGTNLYMDTATTALNAKVFWTINGEPVETVFPTNYLDYDYDGDGNVDIDDGQLLLDVAAGKPGAAILNAAAVTDLDGNGVIDTYDAYLFLQMLNTATVKVPANGSANVVCTVKLLDKALLDTYYTAGAYVEGYVRVQDIANEEGVIGTCHTIPVLGFYGNWTDASMYDVGSYIEFAYDMESRTPYLAASTKGRTNMPIVTFVGDSSKYYLGPNLYDDDNEYIADRAAFSNTLGSTVYGYLTSLIRNAGKALVRVYNAETGELYAEVDQGAMLSAYYHVNRGSWLNTSTVMSLGWKGTDANGLALPEDTSVVIEAVAAPEYYANEDGSYRLDELGENAYLRSVVTIDNTAPELLAVTQDKENKTISLTVKDNRYTAAVLAITRDGDVAARMAVNQAVKGAEMSMVLDLSDLENNTDLYILAADYAGNESTYKLTLGQDPATEISAITVAPAALELVKGTSTTISAATEPWSVQDTLVWSSDDESIATVDQNGTVYGVSKGTTTITVKSKANPAVFATCQVKVITIDYTLTGLLQDTEGNLQSYTWNLETEDTWSKVANTEGNITAAALSSNAQRTTAYTVDANGIMREVDLATGEVLHVGDNGAGFGLDDLTTSLVFGDRNTVNGDLISGVYYYYLIPNKDPMAGDTNAFGFQLYLVFYAGASSFTALTSAGYTQIADKDTGEMLDAEMYFALDDAGNVWMFMIYYDATAKKWGTRFSILNSDLDATFGGDENFYSSLIMSDDGSCLFASIFDGSVNTIYMLRTDGKQFYATKVADFGDGVWPATILCATPNESGTTTTSLRAVDVAESLINNGSQTYSITANTTVEEIAKAAANGSLNAVYPTNQSRKQVRMIRVFGDKGAVKLVSDAEVTNGLVTVNYDADELTPIAVTGKTTLTSWYVSEPGTVVVAYANKDVLAVGDEIASVHFSLKSANSESVVSVSTVEENQEKGDLGTAKAILTNTMLPASSPIDDFPLPIIPDRPTQPTTPTTPTTPAEPSEPAEPAEPTEPEEPVEEDHSVNCPSKKFRDLDVTAWYHEYTDAAISEGLMNGNPDGTFEPMSNLNRAMLVTILWRMEGCPVVDYAMPFADVNADQYFAEAVRWAASTGIVKGVSDTEFAPEDNITREQLAVILWRLAQNKGLKVSNAGNVMPDFADLSQISSWAGEAICWAYDRGIINGKSADLLDPAGTATRVEAATMMVRFQKLLEASVAAELDK